MPIYCPCVFLSLQALSNSLNLRDMSNHRSILNAICNKLCNFVNALLTLRPAGFSSHASDHKRGKIDCYDYYDYDLEDIR